MVISVPLPKTLRPGRWDKVLPAFLSGGVRRGFEEGAEILRCQRLYLFNKLSANLDACLLPGFRLSTEDSGMLGQVHALQEFMLGEGR